MPLHMGLNFLNGQSDGRSWRVTCDANGASEAVRYITLHYFPVQYITLEVESDVWRMWDITSSKKLGSDLIGRHSVGGWLERDRQAWSSTSVLQRFRERSKETTKRSSEMEQHWPINCSHCLSCLVAYAASTANTVAYKPTYIVFIVRAAYIIGLWSRWDRVNHTP